MKVSLLIVQVPVQTERLNPRGTNPARKSLSLCTSRPVPFRPVYRVYAYASYFLLHVFVTTSPHTDDARTTRSHIRTQDRKPLPPSYIHRGLRSTPSRPSILFPSRRAPALSFSLSGTRRERETHNKNNKKCFLPFRLYISHLALSSSSQSLNLVSNPSRSFAKPHRPFSFLFYT